MRHFQKILILAAALTLALPVFSCGDGTGGDETVTDGASLGELETSADDRAALLAAKTQLRNAQTLQETYYAENQTYASSSSKLKTVDPRLNPRIKVISGDETGYEMSVEASDARHTVLTVAKNNGRVERFDDQGNDW